MVYQAEKLVNESGDKLADDDKNTLNTKISALKDAVAKDDADMMKAAKDDLQKALYDVSAKLYQQAAPQGNPQQGAPDMGNAQPNNSGDPNVYDADFKDVDDNN